MKTIDDIVCEMLSVADSAEKKHIYDLRELSSDSLRSYANLIKASHKKELADAVAAKCEVCDQSVTDCNQQKDWRKICAACQEGEYPEDCEYFGEPGGCNAPTMGKHPTCKESLQVGNTAKMREALRKCANYLDVGDTGLCKGECDALREVMQAALSAPARNCDNFNSDTACNEFEKFMGLKPSESIEERNEVMRENWFGFMLWLFKEAKGENK